MTKILSQNFFDRPTLSVAKDLLGKYLVRKIGGKETALMITEVEAYDGYKDKASHVSRGKTERNKIMFGPAGCFYVYFTYGMHWMLNIVTGPKDYPAAVLIRAAVPVLKGTADNIGLVNFRKGNIGIGTVGPARLTKFLKIDKKFNDKKAEPKTGLWFEDRGAKINPRKIIRTPRIRVAYAGPVWANKKYRFLMRF